MRAVVTTSDEIGIVKLIPIRAQIATARRSGCGMDGNVGTIIRHVIGNKMFGCRKVNLVT